MSTITKRVCVPRVKEKESIKLSTLLYLLPDSILADILGLLYVDEMTPLYRTHRAASTHLRHVCIHNVVAWHIRREVSFLHVAPLLERAKSVRHLTLDLFEESLDLLEQIHDLLLKRVNSLHTVMTSCNYINSVLSTQGRLRVLRTPYSAPDIPSEWDLPHTLESIHLRSPYFSRLNTEYLHRLRDLTVNTTITDVLSVLVSVPNLVSLRLDAWEWDPIHEVDIRKSWDAMSKLHSLKEVYITFEPVVDGEVKAKGETLPTRIRHPSLTVLSIRKWQGKYRPHIDCPNLRTLEFGRDTGGVCMVHPQLLSHTWLCPLLHTLDIQAAHDAQWLWEVVSKCVTTPTLFSLRYRSPFLLSNVLTCVPRWSHLRVLVFLLTGVTTREDGCICLEIVLRHCPHLERLIIASNTTSYSVVPSTRATEAVHTHASLRFLRIDCGDEHFWTRWRFPYLRRLMVSSPANVILSDLPVTCPDLVELSVVGVDTPDPPTHPPLHIWRHLTTLRLNCTSSVWKWALYLYHNGTPLQRWTAGSDFLDPPAGWIQPPWRHVQMLADMCLPLLQSGRYTWDEVHKIGGYLPQGVDLYTGNSTTHTTLDEEECKK